MWYIFKMLRSFLTVYILIRKYIIQVHIFWKCENFLLLISQYFYKIFLDICRLFVRFLTVLDRFNLINTLGLYNIFSFETITLISDYVTLNIIIQILMRLRSRLNRHSVQSDLGAALIIFLQLIKP